VRALALDAVGDAKPPETSAKTSPGRSGVPRLTRERMCSARCQPCTVAARCSAASNEGRQISEA
jgi:hypothetical protein